MSRAVHLFDNGIKVYRDQLLELQLERYADHNVHEAEEEGVFLDALARVESGGIYVNVGAAIGYYPLLAASLRKDLKIIAYEPLRIHRRYFLQNIALNGYRSSDFSIHKEGLYKRRGSVNFIVEHYGSMIHERKRERGLIERIREKLSNERIRCITLDDICRRENGDIGLLQMDIQGLEADVLEASPGVFAARRIKRLLIGTHSAEIHRRCRNFMADHGYRVYVDNFETRHQPDGILDMGCESS